MIRYLFSLFSRFRGHRSDSMRNMFLLMAALVAYATSGYMYFELPADPKLTWIDAFWWSIVTMTTVGYGDFFPSSLWGRVLVGFPTMILGVGMLGYILSIAATTLMETRMRKAKGMSSIHFTGHILVCNAGRLDRNLEIIQEVRRDSATADAEIVFVDDTLDELPAEMQKQGIHFVRGDPAREDVLLQANIMESRAVLVQAAHTDPAISDVVNLKIVLTAENISRDIVTIAECMDPANEEYLIRAGCDSVVCISGLTGQMMVQELQDPGVGSIISELTSNIHGKQFYLVDLPKDWDTYRHVLDKYRDGKTLPVGIRRNTGNIILPEADFKLEPGDRIILVSSGRPD